MRTRTCGGPSPISAPGSVRSSPAQRDPSPTPGSSATIVSSTTPSRSVGPEQVTHVARPSPDGATTLPKSVTDQPGGIGHGRYVGMVPAPWRCSANVSYSADAGRHSGEITPWSRHRQLPSAWLTGDAQRGHPAPSVMAPPSWAGRLSSRTLPLEIARRHRDDHAIPPKFSTSPPTERGSSSCPTTYSSISWSLRSTW